MRHLLRILLALTGAVGTLTAQDLHTSYFMETAKYRHQMNPALLENSPYLGALLSNFNMSLYANQDLSSVLLSLSSASISNRGEGGSYISLPNNQVPTELHSQGWRGGSGFNYNYLSIAFNAFGGTNLIECNLRTRMDATSSRQIVQLSDASTATHAYDLSQVHARTYLFGELALGHARRLSDHITVGGKAKVLLGATYADIIANELHISFDTDKWVSSSYPSSTSSILKYSYKINNDGAATIYDTEEVQGGSWGWGLGFDLGMTYKVHGFEDLTLSLGITDIGMMVHKQNKKIQQRQGEWHFFGFNPDKINSSIHLAEVEQEITNIHNRFDRLLQEPVKEIKSANTLASTINVGAEYTLPSYRQLSFGALYSHRLAGVYSSHLAMLSTRIRPLKFIELGVSALTSTYSTNIGAMLTLQAPHFQFFVGSDYIMQDYSRRDTPSANINLGFTIPLTPRKR